MIVIIGRALYWLLCAMTAPHPPIPNLPPLAVPPRPEPPPHLDLCYWCLKVPRQGGSWFCGDTCQRDWIACKNATIPLEATPPTLPDGSQYRRTT